jgi:hypothetical protein
MKVQAIRLLNLGPTNWLRTQSVCRSTAQALSEVQQDTIILSSPLHSYLAVGNRLIPDSVLDLTLCAELDIPVITTPLNHNVSYLNSQAIVFQWVFQQGSTADLSDLLAGAICHCLEMLGIGGVQSEGTHIRSHSECIAVIKSMHLSEGIALQGEFYLQQDYPVLARLKLPSQPAGLWEQPGRPVSPDEVQFLLLESFTKVLGREIVRGRPNQAETRHSKTIDRQLLEEAEILLQRGQDSNARN